jgi:hypothetical protein
MSNKNRYKRGPPQGNQNARKHGFYSRVLDKEEQYDFEQATQVEGIDEEIAILRVKLKSVLRHDPENIRLIVLATESLSRLLRAKYNLNKGDKKGLSQVIGNVLKDIALPLGIDIGKAILKKDDL